jgi:hypothetical protein
LSIVGGILLAVAVLVAFALLPSMVKWVGAALTFLPSRIGLVHMVLPDEVRSVDLSQSPTDVSFASAGSYALFTANYDLLVINDAVLDAKAKPWLKLTTPSGEDVAIELIDRGLALYDTPFAAGRPVARFEIRQPGTYSLMHPTRSDLAYIVPDYAHGEEGGFVFWMLVQLAVLGWGLFYVFRKTRKPLAVRTLAPPSPESRRRLNAEQLKAEQARRADQVAQEAPQVAWTPEPSPAAFPDEVSSDPGARDIVRMLHEKELTAQQADEEIEARMLAQPSGKPGSRWGSALALSAQESEAFAQGASSADLMSLRYDGWPTRCVKCGKPIHLRQTLWWFVRDETGKPGLRHIDCPSK